MDREDNTIFLQPVSQSAQETCQISTAQALNVGPRCSDALFREIFQIYKGHQIKSLNVTVFPVHPGLQRPGMTERGSIATEVEV